jgi:regulator of protease activity HflC (stomatin/prohibitin superfamily)
MIGILIGAIIGTMIIAAFMYLGMCFIETPDDRVRLIVRKGIPHRIQRPGWGLFLFPFDVIYDYSKELIRFDFKAGKLLTKATKKFDENVAFIDSVIYFFLVKSTDGDDYDEKNCFEQVSKLWMRGLRPNAGQMIDDGSVIMDIVEPFVLAKQREIGQNMHWNDLAYTPKFVNNMQSALNEDDMDNPFAKLGLVDITFVAKTISFDPDMEKSLNLLVIARQEGEALIQRAIDEAEAREKKQAAVSKDLQAASIIAFENTANHTIITSADGGKIPIVFGGV